MSKVWYKSKTLLLTIVFSLVGLADLLDFIDLRPLLLMVGVPAEKTDGVMLLLTLLFGALRLATSSGVSARRSRDDDEDE